MLSGTEGVLLQQAPQAMQQTCGRSQKMNDRSDGQPPSQPETPQVVGDSGAVTMIPIADIWVGDRLLPLDEKRIAEIGQSYDDVGQISPITLARVIGPAGEPIRLLTGFHRHVTHKR